MFRRQIILSLLSWLALSPLAFAIIGGKKKEREEPIFNVTPDAVSHQSTLTEAQLEKFFEFVVKGFEAEGREDYVLALASYDKALTVNKESVTVWIRRAYVAAKLGQYEVAAENLKTGTGFAPVSVTDYLTLAWFRATSPFAPMRDGTQAVAYAMKALQEEPSADAYDMLAAGYAEMKNFGKAQETLRTAIKLYPNSGRAELMQNHLELYKNRKPWREAWGRDEKKMDAAVKK